MKFISPFQLSEVSISYDNSSLQAWLTMKDDPSAADKKGMKVMKTIILEVLISVEATSAFLPNKVHNRKCIHL